MHSTEEDLSTFPLRLNARAWGIAMGLLFGLMLFVATNILVLKGGPNVGRHLGLLGAFLPGYRVTYTGSVIGFAYGFAVGYVFGWAIGRLYNALARTPR